jgi:hypothetical protein
MPRDNTKFVVVRCSELSAAIGRVAQFADERSHAVRIKMEQNELKITAQSNESGESEDSIETPYTFDPSSSASTPATCSISSKLSATKAKSASNSKTANPPARCAPKTPSVAYALACFFPVIPLGNTNTATS